MLNSINKNTKMNQLTTTTPIRIYPYIMSNIDEDSLLILLNAQAKETLDDILMTCFRFRLETVPDRKKREWRQELATSFEQIDAIIPAITALIDQCLLESQLPDKILSNNFHPQLANLLNKLFKNRIPDWRSVVMQNQVSPARLVSFDFRVDNTISTDQMTNVNASSLLLNLSVQDTPTRVNEIPTTRNIQLELSNQELKTLLDGMLKVKDQLATIQ